MPETPQTQHEDELEKVRAAERSPVEEWTLEEIQELFARVSALKQPKQNDKPRLKDSKQLGALIRLGGIVPREVRDGTASLDQVENGGEIRDVLKELQVLVEEFEAELKEDTSEEVSSTDTPPSDLVESVGVNNPSAQVSAPEAHEEGQLTHEVLWNKEDVWKLVARAKWFAFSGAPTDDRAELYQRLREVFARDDRKEDQWTTQQLMGERDVVNDASGQKIARRLDELKTIVEQLEAREQEVGDEVPDEVKEDGTGAEQRAETVPATIDPDPTNQVVVFEAAKSGSDGETGESERESDVAETGELVEEQFDPEAIMEGWRTTIERILRAIEGLKDDRKRIRDLIIAGTVDTDVRSSLLGRSNKLNTKLDSINGKLLQSRMLANGLDAEEVAKEKQEVDEVLRSAEQRIQELKDQLQQIETDLATAKEPREQRQEQQEEVTDPDVDASIDQREDRPVAQAPELAMSREDIAEQQKEFMERIKISLLSEGQFTPEGLERNLASWNDPIVLDNGDEADPEAFAALVRESFSDHETGSRLGYADMEVLVQMIKDAEETEQAALATAAKEGESNAVAGEAGTAEAVADDPHTFQSEPIESVNPYVAMQAQSDERSRYGQQPVEVTANVVGPEVELKGMTQPEHLTEGVASPLSSETLGAEKENGIPKAKQQEVPENIPQPNPTQPEARKPGESVAVEYRAAIEDARKAYLAAAKEALTEGKRSKWADKVMRYVKQDRSLSEKAGEKYQEYLGAIKAYRDQANRRVDTKTEERIQVWMDQYKKLGQEKGGGEAGYQAMRKRAALRGVSEEDLQSLDALPEESRIDELVKRYSARTRELFLDRADGMLYHGTILKELKAQQEGSQQIRNETWGESKREVAKKLSAFFGNKYVKGTLQGSSLALAAYAGAGQLIGRGLQMATGVSAGAVAGAGADKVVGILERRNLKAKRETARAAFRARRADVEEAMQQARSIDVSAQKWKTRRKIAKVGVGGTVAYLIAGNIDDFLPDLSVAGVEVIEVDELPVGEASTIQPEQGEVVVHMNPGMDSLPEAAESADVQPAEGSAEATPHDLKFDVEQGDNVWNLMKERVASQYDLSEQQERIFLDTIDDHLQAASQEELAAMGFTTGADGRIDPNLIQAGDHLNLSLLEENGVIDRARDAAGVEVQKPLEIVELGGGDDGGQPDSIPVVEEFGVEGSADERIHVDGEPGKVSVFGESIALSAESGALLEEARNKGMEVLEKLLGEINERDAHYASISAVSGAESTHLVFKKPTLDILAHFAHDLEGLGEGGAISVEAQKAATIALSEALQEVADGSHAFAASEKYQLMSDVLKAEAHRLSEGVVGFAERFDAAGSELPPVEDSSGMLSGDTGVKAGSGVGSEALSEPSTDDSTVEQGVDGSVPVPEVVGTPDDTEARQQPSAPVAEPLLSHNEALVAAGVAGVASAVVPDAERRRTGVASKRSEDRSSEPANEQVSGAGEGEKQPGVSTKAFIEGYRMPFGLTQTERLEKEQLARIGKNADAALKGSKVSESGQGEQAKASKTSTPAVSGEAEPKGAGTAGQNPSMQEQSQPPTTESETTSSPGSEALGNIRASEAEVIEKYKAAIETLEASGKDHPDAGAGNTAEGGEGRESAPEATKQKTAEGPSEYKHEKLLDGTSKRLTETDSKTLNSFVEEARNAHINNEGLSDPVKALLLKASGNEKWPAPKILLELFRPADSVAEGYVRNKILPFGIPRENALVKDENKEVVKQLHDAVMNIAEKLSITPQQLEAYVNGLSSEADAGAKTIQEMLDLMVKTNVVKDKTVLAVVLAQKV
jgi:hypothetical protein